RVFLAEREGAGWRTITYSQTLETTRALAQALLDRGLDATRPLLVLSGNGVDHALFALAAMHVGVPVAPVSTAYSLVAKDPARLRAVAEIVRPGAIYAEDTEPFARAIAALGTDVPRVSFRDGADTTPTRAVDDAFAKVGPDAVAKILFTSGSTGAPKGVANT